MLVLTKIDVRLLKRGFRLRKRYPVKQSCKSPPPVGAIPKQFQMSLPPAPGGAATHPGEGSGVPAGAGQGRGRQGRVGSDTRRALRPTAAVGSDTCRGTAPLRAERAPGPTQAEAGAGGAAPGASPGASAEGRAAGAASTVSREGTSRYRRRRPGALTLGGRPLPSPARRSAPVAPASGGAGQGMCVRGGAFRRRTKPRAGCAAAAASRRTVPMPPPRLLLSASRAGARPAPLPGCLLRQRRRL